MNKLHPRCVIDDSSRIIGRNIKAKRERLQISRHELEKKSGVSHLTIAKLELGNSNPLFCTVARLADALGVSVNRLAHDDSGEVARA